MRIDLLRSAAAGWAALALAGIAGCTGGQESSAPSAASAPPPAANSPAEPAPAPAPASDSEQPASVVLAKGQSMPAWTGKTIAGKTISAADLKGKVVLMNFFN